jgi:hypothetical protein
MQIGRIHRRLFLAWMCVVLQGTDKQRVILAQQAKSEPPKKDQNQAPTQEGRVGSARVLGA